MRVFIAVPKEDFVFLYIRVSMPEPLVYHFMLINLSGDSFGTLPVLFMLIRTYHAGAFATFSWNEVEDLPTCTFQERIQ